MFKSRLNIRSDYFDGAGAAIVVLVFKFYDFIYKISCFAWSS
jgi:hypothetical protein